MEVVVVVLEKLQTRIKPEPVMVVVAVAEAAVMDSVVPPLEPVEAAVPEAAARLLEPIPTGAGGTGGSGGIAGGNGGSAGAPTLGGCPDCCCFYTMTAGVGGNSGYAGSATSSSQAGGNGGGSATAAGYQGSPGGNGGAVGSSGSNGGNVYQWQNGVQVPVNAYPGYGGASSSSSGTSLISINLTGVIVSSEVYFVDADYQNGINTCSGCTASLIAETLENSVSIGGYVCCSGVSVQAPSTPSITIQEGSGTKTVYNGTALTPAEWIATIQVGTGETQTLTLNSSGEAQSGSFTTATANEPGSAFGTLVLPAECDRHGVCHQYQLFRHGPLSMVRCPFPVPVLRTSLHLA